MLRVFFGRSLLHFTVFSVANTLVGMLQLLTTLFFLALLKILIGICAVFVKEISLKTFNVQIMQKKSKEIGAGYKTLSDTLMTFKSNNYYDLPFFVTDNTDSSQLYDTLKNNIACWHKSCQSKFTKVKLNRFTKRKNKELEQNDNLSTEQPTAISPEEKRKKYTRSSLDTRHTLKNDICFFAMNSQPLRILYIPLAHGLLTVELDVVLQL